MLRVYGFPRSGNNLLCAVLGENIYHGLDLSTSEGVVGHWATRAAVDAPKYGRLFAGHALSAVPPDEDAVCIVRSGVAVIASLWASEHFKHPKWRRRTFADYIRTPLDWYDTPGERDDTMTQNPIEHWYAHTTLAGWLDMHIVRYEALVMWTAAVVADVCAHFGLTCERDTWFPSMRIGWFPSYAKWQDVWGGDDLRFYIETLGRLDSEV